MLAVNRPDIFVNILVAEDGKIAEPNGKGLGKFVEVELALLFFHVHEVIGPVEIVLASQREISIVELHAIQEKRMHLILHFDIQVTVVPGGDPNIEPCGVIFGHEHVDGLFVMYGLFWFCVIYIVLSAKIWAGKRQGKAPIYLYKRFSPPK